MVDFRCGGSGKADFVRISNRSNRTVQIESIGGCVATANQKRIGSRGIEAVEIHETYHLFIWRTVVVGIVIRGRDSGPAVVAGIDAVRHERTVSRYEKRAVVHHFSMYVPFEDHDVPRLFRSYGDVERQYGGSVSGDGGRIRILGSRLYDLHLRHRPGCYRRILQLLHVSNELVPSGRRQGRSGRGFESGGVRPYRRYRSVGHEGADHAG